VSEPGPGDRRTIFQPSGLIAVFLITLVDVGVVIFAPGSLLRVPLGAFELLFAPGYALGAILFVRRPLLPSVAEFSVAVGLSVVFNVLVGLVLVLEGAGVAVTWLTTGDVAAVAAGLIVKVAATETPGGSGVGAAVVRELRLPGVRPSYRRVVYALLVATLVAFGGVIYLSVAQPSAGTSTSFAVYGPDGTTATLPRSLAVGEVGLVGLSVVDGYSAGSLSLVVSATLVGLNTTALTTVPWSMPLPLARNATSSLPLSLGYGGSTQMNVTFEFSQPGDYALAFFVQAAGGVLVQGVTLSLSVAA
jgi:uncharacterized membrane protein